MPKEVVLINPCLDYPLSKSGSQSRHNRIWPPLSLAYSAALLENAGFEVKIVDANAERLTPAEVADKIGDSEKIFLTTSTLDRWQCPHLDLSPFLEMVKEIKKKNQSTKIFLVGSHGTIRPEEMLKLTEANV